MNNTIKFIIAICIIAIIGCVTTEPWESAEPDCLDYANAACRAAMDLGYPAGVMHVTLVNTTSRHAVTWIIKDNKYYIWDGAFGRYRTQKDFYKIHRIVEGQSGGSYDYLPGPKTNACPIKVY